MATGTMFAGIKSASPDPLPAVGAQVLSTGPAHAPAATPATPAVVPPAFQSFLASSQALLSRKLRLLDMEQSLLVARTKLAADRAAAEALANEVATKDVERRRAFLGGDHARADELAALVKAKQLEADAAKLKLNLARRVEALGQQESEYTAAKKAYLTDMQASLDNQQQLWNQVMDL